MGPGRRTLRNTSRVLRCRFCLPGRSSVVKQMPLCYNTGTTLTNNRRSSVQVRSPAPTQRGCRKVRQPLFCFQHILFLVCQDLRKTCGATSRIELPTGFLFGEFQIDVAHSGSDFQTIGSLADLVFQVGISHVSAHQNLIILLFSSQCT